MYYICSWLHQRAPKQASPLFQFIWCARHNAFMIPSQMARPWHAKIIRYPIFPSLAHQWHAIYYSHIRLYNLTIKPFLVHNQTILTAQVSQPVYPWPTLNRPYSFRKNITSFIQDSTNHTYHINSS